MTYSMLFLWGLNNLLSNSSKDVIQLKVNLCFRLSCLLCSCWLLCSSASLCLHLGSIPPCSCSPGCMVNNTHSSGRPASDKHLCVLPWSVTANELQTEGFILWNNYHCLLWCLFVDQLPDFWLNIYSNDAPGNPAIENLLDALLDQPGFGTKCMEKEKEDSS